MATDPLSTPAAESAMADVSAITDGLAPGEVAVTQVLVTPTQMRRPWRSTFRTAFQALVALATLVPFVVAGIYATEADYPAVVVQVLAVCSAVARVMALPQVEVFLRKFLPFLSASPKETR